MNRTVLIIDDDELQAKNLAEALQKELSECVFIYEWREEEIFKTVVSKFYSVAMIDLRMDNYRFDGFKIIDLISEVNPYAKVVAVSAYTEEYVQLLSNYMSEGKLLCVSEKESFDKWVPKLKSIIEGYFSKGLNPITVQVLEDSFAAAKNETDAYKKGKLFEDFVVNLFRQMGFVHIENRLKDAALNEMDLIIRNDVEDVFFNKFRRYIFVECKNKPESGIDKNDFIVFNNKVQSSSGNSDLGVMITTGTVKSTVFKEALKECKFNNKIIFLASAEILRLIHTPKMLEEFKEIIDEQVFKYNS